MTYLHIQKQKNLQAKVTLLTKILKLSWISLFRFATSIFSLVKKLGYTCGTHKVHMDQTSRRSWYLAFVVGWFLCSLWLPSPLVVSVGDGGSLSMMDVRGESSSSSSSSLVYPLFWTADAFLARWDLPPASATFSATLAAEGGVYTTGEAV